MANYITNTEELTAIADAIRAKTGESGLLAFPSGFISNIGNLVDTSDADAIASDILSGKIAYVNGSKITGSLVPLDTSSATAARGDIRSGKTAYVNGSKITGSWVPTATISSVSTINNADLYTLNGGSFTLPQNGSATLVIAQTKGTASGRMGIVNHYIHSFGSYPSSGTIQLITKSGSSRNFSITSAALANGGTEMNIVIRNTGTALTNINRAVVKFTLSGIFYTATVT